MRRFWRVLTWSGTGEREPAPRFQAFKQGLEPLVLRRGLLTGKEQVNQLMLQTPAAARDQAKCGWSGFHA